VLIGQAVGGVVFGLIAVWMGWYAIRHPRGRVVPVVRSPEPVPGEGPA
jgi:hypothetical protein